MTAVARCTIHNPVFIPKGTVLEVVEKGKDFSKVKFQSILVVLNSAALKFT